MGIQLEAIQQLIEQNKWINIIKIQCYSIDKCTNWTKLDGIQTLE